jgi:hypothetical protein
MPASTGTGRTGSDEQALDRIAAALDGREWDADTLDAVAEAIRSTGRTIADPADGLALPSSYRVTYEIDGDFTDDLFVHRADAERTFAAAIERGNCDAVGLFDVSEDWLITSWSRPLG